MKTRRSPLVPDLPQGFLGESFMLGFLIAVICAIAFFCCMILWVLATQAPYVLLAAALFFGAGAFVRWRWNPLHRKYTKE